MSNINIEVIIESLKNFVDFIFPIICLIVGIIGLYFMFRIINLSRKAKKIDNVIEKKIKELHIIEIDIISDQRKVVIGIDNSKEVGKRMKEQEIEILRNKKKSLLEQISIYKIFKNN